MLNGTGTRRLPNWVEGFEEYTEPLYAPALFRKWAAISTISGVLERKVWTRTRGKILYPNQYILLVGPPGAGKGLVLSEIIEMWLAVPEFFLAPVSVTKSSLVDSIHESKRRIVRPTENPPYIEYHALSAAIPEFSDFASMYDPSLMSILQSLWDCGYFEERRRTKDIHLKIVDPVFNFIAGTTPSYLNTFMPEGAWDQGFAARIMLIFSAENISVQLFREVEQREALGDKLKDDLKEISTLYGQAVWTVESAKAIQAWVDGGELPLLEHRRLLSYTGRRKAHLIKLCMVASVARANDLTITLEDYQTAINWMVEAEALMPEIFKAMASGGDSIAIEDTWHFVWRIWTDENKPVTEGRIMSFLSERIPAYNVKNVLELMVRSNLLQIHAVEGYGKTTYKPVPKNLQAR